MPTLYVAMLELDNRNEFQGIGNSEFNVFGNAISVADALLSQQPAVNSIKMFMAPEYTFSGHNVTDKGGVNINSLSRSDKHSLYSNLKTASSQYSDIIIVAGSIAYSRKRMFGKRKYLSVCPVLKNGEIILKYYKQTYDGFQSGSSADSFTTKAKGSTFVEQGVNFGIEICSDHRADNKILKKSGQNIDVHLLVSEGMNPSVGAIASRTGGLIVNCDMSGQGGGNGVRTVSMHAKWNRPDIDNQQTGAIGVSQTLASGAKVVLYSGNI